MGAPLLTIAVMGAGSVGCYYGGMLARASASVTLIGRRQHVDAVKERGLLLEIGADRIPVPMAATTEPDGVAEADVVLFCVKSARPVPQHRGALPLFAQRARKMFRLRKSADMQRTILTALGTLSGLIRMNQMNRGTKPSQKRSLAHLLKQ